MIRPADFGGRSPKTYAISWQDQHGLTLSAQAQGVELSRSGIGLHSPSELPTGSTVYIQDQNNQVAGYGVVRHCTPRSSGFFVGIELNEEARKSADFGGEAGTDYYEFLQISPKAEQATVNRVYRFLAGRYHPDNPETGDAEKFLLLNRAFEILSQPDCRAAYDALRECKAEPLPAFESVDFMDGVEGEINRRLAVLSLLYRRCRADVENPKVTLAEMETLMGFPREYLDFTTWYLRSKKFITREDNSDFALTVLGVDYIESNYAKLPMLRKLLNAGTLNRNAQSTPAAENPPRDGFFMLGAAQNAGQEVYEGE